MRYIDDVLVLVGCVLILIFVYHINPIYCWLVGGLMCLGMAVLISLTNRRPQ